MVDQLSIGSLFLEGLLSFFSPCVLPLVPLYIGYLTQDARIESEDGTVTYKRSRTLYLTIAFILGICTVFVIAGLGSSALHTFFTEYTFWFQLVGGILLILFGLVALHIIRIPFLDGTHMHTTKVQGGMNFLKAFGMGFFFSFAWTPCVGPLLAQAILQAASAETHLAGRILMGSYAVGFICIFLLIGFFTSEVLNLLQKHKKIVKYTGIVSGILVVCMGVYMLSQAWNTNQAQTSSNSSQETISDSETPDFTLQDANGQMVSLRNYRGKTVLLNFFGTWCYYCNQELPVLQKIQDTDPSVEVLLVAMPGFNGEGDQAYVEKYMKDAGYSLHIVYDTDLSVVQQFGVSGFPTTFVVKPNGEFLGYIPGYIEEANLLNILDQAKE